MLSNLVVFFGISVIMENIHLYYLEEIMVLACHNITKTFGDHVIITCGSFHIENREKAALVGINGAGKSTILKIMIGELNSDAGEVILAKDRTIGYLSQHQELSVGHTIYQEVGSAKAEIIALEAKIREQEQVMKGLKGRKLNECLKSYHHLTTLFEQQNGYAYESEVTGVLKGLGFQEEDFQRNVDSLSGGQKTRVSLGKLLLTKPDILLLDEPTNHLDLNSIAWLESYLLNYPGAVLMVSHDRYFLNRLVTKVIEIENGTLSTFMGNYTDYSKKRRQLREAKLKEYLNQQQEIKHQSEVIQKLKSFNREKSIKRAESREKLLAKMVPVEKPLEVNDQFHIRLEPSILSGNHVLTVEGLSKSFPPQTLFEDISFDIMRGEHIALIGDNGTGKTTLLKILNGIVPADAGNVQFGSNVKVGYYDQEHHVLHSEKSIFDEISDDFPTLTNTEIRNTLAAFLFTGDDVYKQISDLSGGERGRVSLAKLMLSEANFLILDEPTNHLDITSKEILEKALNDYTGTVLYVSHDRYFINQTATRILDLVNHKFVNYIGNYDYYLEKKEELTLAYTTAITNTPIQNDNSTSDSKLDWKAKKEAGARKRKQENELKKTEERIHLLEEKDKEIDLLLTDPEVFSKTDRCLELTNEKAGIVAELEQLYEKWETICSQ